MDVAARARAIGGELRHEGHRAAHLLGDFLQALLVDHVAVRHLQRFGVSHVDFMLSQSPFAFRALDANAGCLQVASHGRREWLISGPLQDVIVLEIPAGRLKRPVVRFRCLTVAVLKEVVLQLRRGMRREAQLTSRFDLAPKQRARCD